MKKEFYSVMRRNIAIFGVLIAAIFIILILIGHEGIAILLIIAAMLCVHFVCMVTFMVFYKKTQPHSEEEKEWLELTKGRMVLTGVSIMMFVAYMLYRIGNEIFQ